MTMPIDVQKQYMDMNFELSLSLVVPRSGMEKGLIYVGNNFLS